MLEHFVRRARAGARRAAPRPIRNISAPGVSFPVYLVEPERGLRIGLTRDLCAAGFETRPFADAGDLATALPELAPGCVVVDIAAIARAPAPLREQGGEGMLRFPTILTFSALKEEDAIAAVRLGAADLLTRPAAVDELVAALHRAAPRVADLALRLSARRARAAVDALTPRERQVMECMMHGLSNKETARELGISPRTVEMHRARLHRHLAVSSLAELLALAWRAHGLGAH